ncbi:hypothetical protein ONE63_007405 [Megalurothrips usitatus]|uniref:Uncharacterized protein n=1 Tax=Megalurothrips usitatus TaxID=439358 RepID=A0AAV7XU57_9NEOP|nr:hypothetical protein ONE63_007405 [Megalurothrips usitatus]
MPLSPKPLVACTKTIESPRSPTFTSPVITNNNNNNNLKSSQQLLKVSTRLLSSSSQTLEMLKTPIKASASTSFNFVRRTSSTKLMRTPSASLLHRRASPTPSAASAASAASSATGGTTTSSSSSSLSRRSSSRTSTPPQRTASAHHHGHAGDPPRRPRRIHEEEEDDSVHSGRWPPCPLQVTATHNGFPRRRRRRRSCRTALLPCLPAPVLFKNESEARRLSSRRLRPWGVCAACSIAAPADILYRVRGMAPPTPRIPPHEIFEKIVKFSDVLRIFFFS